MQFRKMLKKFLIFFLVFIQADNIGGEISNGYCPSGLKVLQDIAVIWDNSFNNDTSGYSQITDFIYYYLFRDDAYQLYPDDHNNRVTQIASIPFPETLIYLDYKDLKGYDYLQWCSDLSTFLSEQYSDGMEETFGNPKYSNISEYVSSMDNNLPNRRNFVKKFHFSGLAYLPQIENTRRAGVNNTVIIISKSDENVDEALAFTDLLKEGGAQIVVIGIGPYENVSRLTELASSNLFWIIPDLNDWDSAQTVGNAVKSVLAQYCPESDANTTLPSIPSTPAYVTPPPPTINYDNCYGIIFSGEMSVSISLQQKRDFLSLINDLIAYLNYPLIENLQYAVSTYGTHLYRDVIFESQYVFYNTISHLFSELPSPNGDATRLLE